MRILKSSFILFSLTFSIIFFMGCPQGPQDPLLNNYINPVVGVWKLIEWSLTNHTDDIALVFDEAHVSGTLELKEDQTYQNTPFQCLRNYIWISYWGIFTQTTNGTWITSGNEITVTCLSCDMDPDTGTYRSVTFIFTITESIATASFSLWQDDQFGVPKYWTYELKFRKQ